MFVLTRQEYHQRAEPELRKIFLGTNSHLPLFGSNVEDVKILYEYLPPDTQIINAIIQSASALGDTGLYISITNQRIFIDETKPPEPWHWWVPFDEIPIYLSGNTDLFGSAYLLENVIYSPQGKWGLMYSFEKYGILAGTKDFIEHFSGNFPSIDRQILQYLDLFRECINVDGLEKTNLTWLGSFLKKVYGTDAARALLQESQLEAYVTVE
jgi:hypothetical protein